MRPSPFLIEQSYLDLMCPYIAEPGGGGRVFLNLTKVTLS